MKSKVVSAIIKARWLLLIILTGLAVLASIGQGRLGFSTDYRAYLSYDNSELQALEEMQATYDKSDNLLIAVAPRSGDIFSRTSLEALEWITQEAWQVPYSVRVESLVNFQDIQSHGDDIQVADLVRGAAQLSDAELARIRVIAQAEPQLVNRLLAKGGQAAAVNVIYHLPGISPFENYEVVGFARDLVNRVNERYPDIQVHLTGMAMYNNAFLEAALDDSANLTPLVYLIIAVATMLMLRNLIATLTAIAVVYLAMVSSMGFAGWLGMSLTSLSASAPLMILMVGVADSVHLLSVTLMGLRKGLEKSQAVKRALEETIVPITVTSATTLVAFLSLNFSEMPPFRDLGNIVALGVIAAWLLSILLLPALLMLLPLRVKIRANGGFGEAMMENLGRWVVARSSSLLWIGLPLSVLLIVMAGRNELNDQYLKWFDPNTAFSQANEFTERNLTGLYGIEYSLRSYSSSGVAEPAFLNEVDRFTQWLRDQPEVAHVSSLSDTIKRINLNLHGGRQENYTIPQNSKLAAQGLLLYEQSLPYGLDLNNQLDVDKAATRVVISLYELSTAQMLAFEQRSLKWLSNNAHALQAKAASTTLVFAHIGQSNIESMVWGILFSAIVVALLLIAVFRSWRFGLLSLIPNILPIMMAFGIWGILVGQVGFSVAIVASMTLGIVVDDTIHFMHNILNGRKEGRNVDEAIIYAFKHTGPALMTTTIALIAGFLVLSTSQFALNREMGLVTALTLILALLADFFLLPGLLKKLMGKRDEN